MGRAADLQRDARRTVSTGGRMFHEPSKLTLLEPDDILDELGSWWRDVAAGSALAAIVVTAAVLFLK